MVLKIRIEDELGNVKLSFKTLKTLQCIRREKGRDVKKYYLKNEINQFVKTLTNYDSEYPIDHVFNYEGKIEKIPFEDLLFIHQFRSTTSDRAFYNKVNIIPLNVLIINAFVGNRL